MIDNISFCGNCMFGGRGKPALSCLHTKPSCGGTHSVIKESCKQCFEIPEFRLPAATVFA